MVPIGTHRLLTQTFSLEQTFYFLSVFTILNFLFSNFPQNRCFASQKRHLELHKTVPCQPGLWGKALPFCQVNGFNRTPRQKSQRPVYCAHSFCPYFRYGKAKMICRCACLYMCVCLELKGGWGGGIESCSAERCTGQLCIALSTTERSIQSRPIGFVASGTCLLVRHSSASRFNHCLNVDAFRRLGE